MQPAQPLFQPPHEPRILHILNLDTIGGVEQLFFHFICSLEPNLQAQTSVLITGNKMHPNFASGLTSRLSSIHYNKQWHGIKVPKRPRSLRTTYLRRLLQRLRPTVSVLWNRLDDMPLVSALRQCGSRIIYYEHGAAWLRSPQTLPSRFFDEVDAVICISHAAKRVIQLRWQFQGHIEVIPNAIRPDLVSLDHPPKRAPQNRPVRVGIAGRLIPLKGVGIALHAMAELRQSHPSHFELYIAGTGPLDAFLYQTTRELDLEASVRFLGPITDMSGFYNQMDLVVIPSVREPFGLVGIEAGAHGCPVIVSRVDGLPETVIEGETGYCITPTLPLQAGLRFGGKVSDFPPQVYDAATDCLTTPRFVDPAKVAACMIALFSDATHYERLSAAMIHHVRSRFQFTTYISALQQAILAETMHSSA